MRQIMLLAALTLAGLVTVANAQDSGTVPGTDTTQQPQAPQPEQFPGPISGGVYHQPTAAEIEQRERDTKAAQQRQQQESREVDQLYNQLIHPNPPCSAPQGCAGSSP